MFTVSTAKNHTSNLFLSLIVTAMLLISEGCDQRDLNQFAIITENDSIATVNNAKIPLGAFRSELSSFLQQYRRLVHPDEKQLDVIRKFVIHRMVNDELISQEAIRKGINVTPEELDHSIAQFLAPYQSTDISSILKGKNINEAQWKDKLAKLMVKKKLVQIEVIDKIAVTKREIRKYHQENRNKLVTPQSFRVRNITLSTKKEAKAILQKLKKGEDFVNLVREYSISPDKNSDGDLGYIQDGDLPKAMQKAIFKLGFNSSRKRISDIVEAQDGFHIFKLLAYQKRKKPTQRQATSMIREILANQKWSAAYAGWIRRLRDNAKIVIDQEMLSSEKGY